MSIAMMKDFGESQKIRAQMPNPKEWDPYYEEFRV